MGQTKLIVINSAAPEDLAGILSLLMELNLPPNGVADHLASAFVARRTDGVLAGCAAVELYGTAGLLRSVGVRPEFRGLGLGDLLVRNCLDMARGRGVQFIYLLTETASGYFPRFGFRPLAREEVDAAVKQSVEFTVACPEDAQAMVLALKID